MKIYGLKLTKKGTFTLFAYFLLVLMFITYLVMHGNNVLTIIAAIIGASAFPFAVINSIFVA